MASTPEESAPPGTSTGQAAQARAGGYQPSAIPPRLGALLEAPAASALVVDFDGTIAEIVDDPALAAPLPGAAEALSALAKVLGMVAVLSGRPVSFLAERLQPLDKKVRLVGLYGMEHHSPDPTEPGEPSQADSPGRKTPAELREAIASVVAAARQTAPPGLRVEDKGLSVALHWRNSPELATWATDFAARQAGRHGLLLIDAKMAVELLPPNAAGKGAAVHSLVEQMVRPCRAICYVGDDVGDLQAFHALDRLAADGKSAVKVAVASAEAPSALLEAADLVLASPHDLLEVLRTLGHALGQAADA